jgi:SPX domain protein involved in polyphosphate accumulation
MLLMSAVEEADGYTAVGAELMHVLRFILVNLLAVKKICKKHDRLLMQRMLGGYYQRTRAHHDSVDRYSHIEDAHTLGGLVARVSGDIYDAHP